MFGTPALTVVEQTEFQTFVANVEQFDNAVHESLFFMFCETVLNKLEDKSTLNDTALAYALELFWKYPSRYTITLYVHFYFPKFLQ